MRIWLLPLCCLPFVVGAARAEENCSPVLQPSIVDFSLDTETKLALLDSYESTADEKKKTGIGGSYGDYSFNYDQAKDFSNTLKRLLNVNYSNKEKKSIYLSSFPSNVLDAYVDCLRIRKEDIEYSFTKSVLSPSFFFVMKYHPQYPGAPAGDQKAQLTLTQGTFVESGKSTLTFKIAPNALRTVGIQRDVFEPTEISIQIGPSAAVIDVPARSKSQVVLIPVKGPDFHFAGNGTRDDIGGDTCVEAPAGSVLVPRSFAVVYTNQTCTGGVACGPAPGIAPTTVADDFKACTHIRVYFPTPINTFADVKGHSEAVALTTKPADGFVQK